MFGKNRQRGFERNAKLQVHEIFYTIQGEGPYSGIPAVFIRLTGCNLACSFCDTHWDDDEDLYWSIDEIMQEIKDVMAPHCTLAIITGGEPLRQDAVVDLSRALIDDGWTVQIETAGTIWNERLPKPVEIVVSPKTHRVMPGVAARAIAWKYIIREGQTDPEDGLPLKVARHPAGFDPDDIYCSPCDEHDDEKTAANYRLVAKTCMQHGYRAMVQLHKLLKVE